MSASMPKPPDFGPSPLFVTGFPFCSFILKFDINDGKRFLKFVIGEPFKNHPTAEFLSKKEWTHWVTLTTRSPLSLSSARRGVIRLVNILKIRVNFNECFFASEPFDCKVGYHIHMLVNANTKDSTTDMLYEIRSSWREAMREPNARVSVSKYNPEENATGYISKYIQKWLSDYDYYTFFNNDKIGDGIEEWQRKKKTNNGQKSRDALQKLYKEFKYSVDDIRNLEYDVFENYYTKYKSDRDIEIIEKEIYGN